MAKKHTIKDCHDIAESKGGKCLSTHYKDNKQKIEWQCKNGHIFTMKLNAILSMGCWCSQCKKDRITLQTCKDYASLNGGECLSTEYKNCKQQMTWKCKCDHIWFTRFSYIKHTNSWCPRCSSEKQKATLLKRYGVTNPSFSQDIALKIARKTNKPSIKFHWQTNEELVCQGSYEAKVVDYLNTNQVNYKWQPETFILSNGKTYRPDLYLVDSDIWIEIKGYFRNDAKAKWDEFEKTHPNSELWNENKLKSLKII